MKYLMAVGLCVLLTGCAATGTSGVSNSSANNNASTNNKIKYDTFVKPAFTKLLECGARFQSRYGYSKADAASLDLAIRSYCQSEIYAYRKGSETYFAPSSLPSAVDKAIDDAVKEWSAHFVGPIIQRNL